MSATSGPLDEPDFAADHKLEPVVAPETAAALATNASAPVANGPAEK